MITTGVETKEQLQRDIARWQADLTKVDPQMVAIRDEIQRWIDAAEDLSARL